MAVTKYQNLNDVELYQRCINFIKDYNKLRSRLTKEQVEELDILSLKIGHKLKSKKCGGCLLNALNKVRGYIKTYEEQSNNTRSIDNGNSVSEPNIEEVVEQPKPNRRGRKRKTITE